MSDKAFDGKSVGTWLPVGMAIGIALGLTVFDNVGVGVGIGVALGMGMATAVSATGKSGKDDETGDPEV
ncbi:hypothetical protein FB384_002028 [Prauserella sediminis]|uniref:Glycine zipper family protein n=1 Tax=Prauserella sediminis TaxID=577680 RepID=A0A839XNR4_9PSEU|nr:hypothetical protein [Prauserella sediminis]MBB3663124.1 hypothetical protein [Prauserella sediminis]